MSASVTHVRFADSEPRIWTMPYAALCIMAALYFLGFGALIPTLPKYVQDHGASTFLVGCVGGSFWAPAVLLRPFLGRWIDRKGGHQAIAITGLALSAAAIVGYARAISFSALLALRVLHGAGFSMVTATAYAVIAALAPTHRRAEAVGYYSMFVFLGYALGPALGEQLFVTGHASSVFSGAAVASSGALVVVAFALRVPRVVRGAATTGSLLHRGAVLAIAILAPLSVATATAETFVPLYVRERGLGDVRLFFVLFATSLITTRGFAGRISDRWGRAFVIVPGALLCALAMLCVSMAKSTMLLRIAAVLLGAGWGAAFPGIFALAIDRVDERKRATTTTLVTAAFDLSFGGVQLGMGAVVADAGYGAAFLAATGAALWAALVTVLFGRRRG